MNQSQTLETIPAVKNIVQAFRQGREEHKAKEKAEKEESAKAIREEAERIRDQARDAALAREACH